MQAQEGGQALVGGNIGEDGAAVSEREDEAREFVLLAFHFDGAYIAPVHLGLMAGRGLEATHRHCLRALTLGMDILLENGVAPV